ncbi:Forkhead box protein D2 [Marasmius sp. AFHP31]|nr:Forkhead box protein D2 [Marasmius sp. AFHP31]
MSHRFGVHAQVQGHCGGERPRRQVAEGMGYRSGEDGVYESSAYIAGSEVRPLFLVPQENIQLIFKLSCLISDAISLPSGHALLQIQNKAQHISGSSSHTTYDLGYEHYVPTYHPPDSIHYAMIGQQPSPLEAVLARDAPTGLTDMAPNPTRPSRPRDLSAISTFPHRPDGYHAPSQNQVYTHAPEPSSPSNPGVLPALCAAAGTSTSASTSHATIGTTVHHPLETDATDMDQEENLRVQYRIPQHLPLSLDVLEDPAPGERPALSLPALVQLAIWSSPGRRLRLREIVEVIRGRFECFKGEGGQKLAASVRHLLSLHSVFKRLPKEVEYSHHDTESTKIGTKGKRTQTDRGRYWVLDLTQPLTDTKRPRKRRPKTRAQEPVSGSKGNMEGQNSDGHSAGREANGRFLELVDPGMVSQWKEREHPKTVSSPSANSYLSPGSSSDSPFSPYSSSGSMSSSSPLPLSDSALSPYSGSTMPLSPLPLSESPEKETPLAGSYYHVPGEQTHSDLSKETSIVPASQSDTPIVGSEAVDLGQHQQQQQQLLPSSFSTYDPYVVHGSYPEVRDPTFITSSTSGSEPFYGWDFVDSFSQELGNAQGYHVSGQSELLPAQPGPLAPLLFTHVQQLGNHNGYEDFAPNTQSAHRQDRLSSEAMSLEQDLYARVYDSFNLNLNF